MAHFVGAGSKYINVEHISAVYMGDEDLTIYYDYVEGSEGYAGQTYLEGEEAAMFRRWLEGSAEVR